MRWRTLMNEEVTAARECNLLKTKRCRERKKATETIKSATRKGFATPQAYGKAIKKLKSNCQNYHPKELKQ